MDTRFKENEVAACPDLLGLETGPLFLFFDLINSR